MINKYRRRMLIGVVHFQSILIACGGFALADNNAVSTYLGGSADDGFCGIQATTDSLGYIYAAGYTLSDDIPTGGGAYQPDRNDGYDIFVAKLDPHLTTLVAATYLGGSADEQYPAIAMNHLGQVIITGYTYSSDYPTTSGVFQPSFGGGSVDAFVTVLNGDLTTRISSTYIGGSAHEGPYNRLGLRVSASNEIYITGTTNSGDFPTSPGAYRGTPIGDADLFISRLSADLSTLVASTYFGGSGDEAFPELTVDNSGNIVVGSSTRTNDYPTTPGAYNRVHSGSYFNGAISKLDPGLSTLIASTFVGDVSTVGMTADGDGSFFVTGHTDDVNYPTSITAYDRTHNGVNEAIITKLDNNLENLLASTFLSGTGNGQGVSGSPVVDAGGFVYAVVTTNWPDMPTTPDALDRIHNGGGNDAYIVKLDNDLSTLHYASFIGGTGDDAPSSMELDPADNPVMAGMSKSLDFWTSDDCYEPEYNGGTSDCFVAKFSFNQCCGRYTDGLTGNANCSEDGKCTLSDITQLIDRVYISKAALCCEENGNTNGDPEGLITLSDITRLIDHVYISKQETAPCGAGVPGSAGFLIGYTDCKDQETSTTSSEPTSNQSCIEWNYMGMGELHITHVNAGLNCCPEILADVSFDGSTIVIEEIDSLHNGGCLCLCLYDLQYRITGVEPGEFRIIVAEPYWNEGDPVIEFTIDLTTSPTGSHCVTRLNYPWGQ